MADAVPNQATVDVLLKRLRSTFVSGDVARADVLARNPGVVIIEMRTSHRFFTFVAKSGTTTEATWPNGMDVTGYKLAPKLPTVALPARGWCSACCKEVAVENGRLATHERGGLKRGRACAKSGAEVKRSA